MEADKVESHDAVAGQVERHVRPRAWAIFVDGNHARMWGTLQPHVQKFAEAEGLDVTPLYALEWRTVESAPADVPVLLYCPHRCETNEERQEVGVYRNSRGGSVHAWATHWMPLLAGPNV